MVLFFWNISSLSFNVSVFKHNKNTALVYEHFRSDCFLTETYLHLAIAGTHASWYPVLCVHSFLHVHMSV